MNSRSAQWLQTSHHLREVTRIFTAAQIWLPVPDYASRCLLWPALFARHGVQFPHDFDLSTLAHVSEGYTSGALDAVTTTLLTSRRKDTLGKRPLNVAEVL